MQEATAKGTIFGVCRPITNQSLVQSPVSGVADIALHKKLCRLGLKHGNKHQLSELAPQKREAMTIRDAAKRVASLDFLCPLVKSRQHGSMVTFGSCDSVAAVA